jgi:Zn-dependent membrane protease YugP
MRCALHACSALCSQLETVLQMKGMAQTTKHVLLLSAIPIVYPSLGKLETLLVKFDHAGSTTEKFLHKTGTIVSELLPSVCTAKILLQTAFHSTSCGCSSWY